MLLDGVKLGDVNGDNEVTICDVTEIQRFIAGLQTIEGVYLHAADVNHDDDVTIADATAIQMYLAHYNLDFAIDEVMTQ
ncbi:MAG: dockerin type I repeat-containing protein [Ruminococcus sp.]|nr:dockerin type I repeat-containing protein [Ruminococcus sp.]